MAEPPAQEAVLGYSDVGGVLEASDGAGTAALRRESVEAAVDRWEAWRSSSARDAGELALLGTEVGRALVPPAARRRLQRAIAAARERGVPFRLFVEGDAGFLARIPWEALRLEAASPNDPVDGVLALQPDVSLLRRARDLGPPTAPRSATPGDGAPGRVSEGTRVLVVTADPGSGRYPRLAWLAAEARAIEGTCGRALVAVVTVRTLFDASPEELRRAIVEFQPHVFHFSGHAEAAEAAFERIGGAATRLVLHGSQPGAVRLLDAGTVGGWLAGAGCRLAVLSACETDGGLGSAAVALRRAGLAAAVGIQAAARDASLPTFSRTLYGALLDGTPVDRAVAEARLALVGPTNAQVLPTLWCDAPFALVGSPSFSLPAAVPNNLRAAVAETPTVGRARELAAIDRALGSARAACLVGAGGMGKSHLAGAVARRRIAEHPDGVWFVACDAMETEEDVWSELAALLGAEIRQGPEAAVREALRGRRTLVVLDGFERLAARGSSPRESAAELVAALRETPGTSLLVTSRTAVEGAEMVRIEVGPLAFGSARGEAESLFLDLAGADRSRISAASAAAATEICAALDGVPLALTVAAGRARLVGVAPLRDLLAQSPLRALGGVGSPVGIAVERSLALLAPSERELLGRLSVFAGGFDWASAAEVYPDDRFELLDGLERLAAGSLLRRTEEGEHARFGILDAVRDYLAATMRTEAEAPERTTARRRHLDRYLALARHAADAFHEGNWTEGARVVRSELANFRAALAFARDHALHEARVAFARCLCRPLMESGRASDFGRFAAEGREAAEIRGDRALPADLLGLEGALANRMGDKARCEEAWARRAVLCRESDDAVGEVDATLDRADLAMGRGEFDRALDLVAAAEGLLVGLDRPELEATAAVIRATVELERGHPERAREAVRDAEARVLGVRGRDLMLYVRSQLGYLWYRLDEPLRAEAAFASVIVDAAQGERHSQTAISALWLSRVLEGRGKIEAALMAVVAAEGILERLGSRRRGDAERRRIELCRSHAHHPCLQRLDGLRATPPAELLDEAVRRSGAAQEKADNPAEGDFSSRLSVDPADRA